MSRRAMLREITTDALAKLIELGACSVVDVRPPEAYNGWALRHEPRGGHIRSARSLPVKWTQYLDWVDIIRAKGLRPEIATIVYGYDRESSEKVAHQLNAAGFEDVRHYGGFLNEWAPTRALPMDRLPRYRQLVSAEWLCELLHGNEVREHDGARVVVCHAHYRNPNDYLKGHIPHAVALDTNALESPETWNRRSPPELKAALEALGITCDTTVVVYGRFSFPDNRALFPGSSAGHLGAMRCAFILLYAGVHDVRVLNGGVQSWEDAGFPLDKDIVQPERVYDFGAPIPGRPELVIDRPDVDDVLRSSDANLVSVRSWAEYIGEVSGYNYIEKRGRVPGAVFGNCGSDAYHMENYRNLDHTCREYHEVEAMWREVGITPDKRNVFCCGTGWRGSEAFFNAWLMQWPRIAVYDGGWFEWSSDPANPIETGVPGTSPS